MNIIKAVDDNGFLIGYLKPVFVKDWHHNLRKTFMTVDEHEATRFNDTESKLVLGFMGLAAQRKGYKLDIVNV